MSHLIKTINDPAQFEKVFYKFFLKSSNIYLKTQNGDLKVDFFGFSEGNVAFKIPYIKNLPPECLVVTRYQCYTIYVQLKYVEKQEDEIYILFPVKVQIITAERTEERKSLEVGGESKTILYATDLYSDMNILGDLGLNVKKIERVKEIMHFDLDKIFKSVKLLFISESSSDIRLKYIYETREHIYMPTLNSDPSPVMEKSYAFYINEIYATDYYLRNRKNLISEITVPILFRGRIPFGYIQVNHDNELTEGQISVMKRMAVVCENLCHKNQVFSTNNDKLLICDISSSGVGIVFNDRKFIRHFKEDCYVTFTINLPTDKKCVLLVQVKNISVKDNKIFKVGCQIVDMDSSSRLNYTEILTQMGLN